jgi:hypothetical protein
MAVSVAAVTMMYNEPDMAPIWARHYAQQLGARNCYVVDHGSDDGSPESMGPVNVIRIPRTPFDELQRNRLITKLCAALLEFHDFVVHADIDEIVLPDPRHYAGLRDYCEACPRDVTYAIGLNVQHLPMHEAPLDLARPVTEQRRHVWFGSTMCKPLLIRRPVQWSEGFHCCEAPVQFGDLYMFHLRWYDLGLGLRRLAKTRGLTWDNATRVPYQRSSDSDFTRLFNQLAARPVLAPFDFDPDRPPLRDMLQATAKSWVAETHWPHRISLRIASPALWPIPECFRGRF